jgi:hypothetical protein
VSGTFSAPERLNFGAEAEKVPDTFFSFIGLLTIDLPFLFFVAVTKKVA